MKKFILGVLTVLFFSFSSLALAEDRKDNNVLIGPEVILPVKVELNVSEPEIILPAKGVITLEEKASARPEVIAPEIKVENIKFPEVIMLESKNAAKYHDMKGCADKTMTEAEGMTNKEDKEVGKEYPKDKVMTKQSQSTATPSLIIEYDLWENKPDPKPVAIHKKHSKYSKYSMREKDERTAGFIVSSPEGRKLIKKAEKKLSYEDERTSGFVPEYTSKHGIR